MSQQHLPAGTARWVVLGAALLACAYLPTLATRFDFIDDGNLVYPAPPLPAGARLALVWRKVVANYEHLGPFRPVLWAHWEAEAELFRGDPLLWRAARLAWTACAAGALLWLLRELRVRPAAALAAAALAIWNPYRGEIWTSLTLSEGVAMPYALFGLACAARGGRSPRPWPWDLAGALGVLAALGCKNTFAALVPAQVLLRLASDGESLREAWRRHGTRAALLALTLLLPAGHFVVFKLGWRPGQYETGAAPLAQLAGMLRAVAGALGADLMGAGLLLTVLALAAGGRLKGIWDRHRAAIRAGLALLAGGVVVYLPISGISGRYSMPAVWGADILVAVLLTELFDVASARWRRPALVAVGCGLAAVLAAGVGRQQRFAARADVLWQALAQVERAAPRGACVGWVEGRHLNREEGIHFCWHLHARGRPDLTVRLLDADGNPVERRELAATDVAPRLFVTGGPAPLPAAGEPLKRFRAFYWRGARRYDLTLWSAGAGYEKSDPRPGGVADVRDGFERR